VLSLALSVRLTNVFVLPALVIAYTGDRPDGNYRERLWRALGTRPLHVIGLTTLVITFLLLVPGLVSGSSADAHVTLRYAPAHVLFYQFVMLGGLAIPIVAPMALVGARRVWRAAPSTLIAVAYVFLVWPFVHAPFHFVNERYMLMPLFFALLLATHGPAEWWRIAGTRRPAFARMGRTTAVMAPLLLAAVYVLIVGQMLRGWGDDVGLSDESALEELRPVVAAVDDDALVVTAIARGFHSPGDNREYFDLIDHRIDMRDRTSSVAAVISTIDRALMEGRSVYYVYSRFEEDGENAGLGGAGIDIYFSGVEDTYAIRELFRAQQPEYRVYRVMPRE